VGDWTGGPVGEGAPSATAPRPPDRTRRARPTDDAPLQPWPTVAGRIARLAGGYFDLLVVAAFFGLAGVHDRSSVAWAAIGWALYVVPSTAAHGRTLGKLAAGTRVVDVRTMRPPAPRLSLLRWAVLAGPTIVLALVAGDARTGVAWLGTSVVLAPITWDVLRRGLHDRAAGTLVIRTR
jgi:uncharacterized RDD family membrane protein YckC